MKISFIRKILKPVFEGQNIIYINGNYEIFFFVKDSNNEYGSIKTTFVNVCNETMN